MARLMASIDSSRGKMLEIAKQRGLHNGVGPASHAGFASYGVRINDKKLEFLLMMPSWTSRADGPKHRWRRRDCSKGK